ncbi:MAG TPA: sugar phosphate isomerase/epimerase, partial [Clostridia bacterium]|nr:sugar phosphate isomerase/epimerase [Clostridia bacterium]
MRLSTSDDQIYHLNYSLSYIERMERLYRAGFRVLDLNLTDYQHDGSPFRAPDWKAWLLGIRDRAAELGVTFTQSHAPVYNFGVPGYYDDEKHELMRRSFEACEILGIPWLVLHISRPPLASLEETESLNRAYIQALLPWAYAHRVGIAVENLAAHREPPDAPSRSFLQTPEALLAFVENFSDAQVGICIDLGHALIQGWDVPRTIDVVGRKLRALHVQDNNGVDDQHMPPFFGKIPWPEVMRSLKRNAYAGDFTYELCGPMLMRNAPEALQDAMHAL